MNHKVGFRRSQIPWWVFAVSVAAALGSITVGLLNPVGQIHREPVSLAMLYLAFLLFAAVGALVVSRRPESPLGWVFAAVGLLSTCGALADGYAAYGLRVPSHPLSGSTWAAWVAAWYWYPVIMLATTFTLLLFPSGLPSRRWRPLLWLATAVTIGIAVPSMLQRTIRGDSYRVINPIGFLGGGDLESTPWFTILTFLALGLAVMGIVSLAVRFARSRGEEREQLKWFVYAGSLFLCFILLSEAIPSIGNSSVGDVLNGALIASLPAACGVAILKYHLYDIDRIINRTIVYAIVTGLLAATYFGVVLLVGALSPLAQDSPAVVAISTLVVAGLFRPLRGRMQSLIDRRFSRARFDVQKTLGEFSVDLRDEVDIDSLGQRLVEVVATTMQPESVSLWLLPGGEPRKVIGSAP
jgi:hypothetical protein